MIRLTTYAGANEFLASARSYLESAEEVNGLLLGLAIRLVDEPLAYGSPPYFAVATEEGRPALAALMTPPHNLIMYSDGLPGAEALHSLARNLVDGRWPVAGAVGPAPLVEAFAGEWRRERGVVTRRGMSQRIYKLTRVIEPDYSSGALRQAGAGDVGMVLAWIDAFQSEALPHGQRAPEELFRRRIADGEIYLWDDGGPVSMAMRSRPTRRGISVGSVYTPPERRRRGYASSCVAALSRLLLDDGFEYCTLFTDIDNPTSNDIYQRIGYRAVCDFQEVRFEGRA